jgi:hypothetical protein
LRDLKRWSLGRAVMETPPERTPVAKPPTAIDKIKS